MYTHERALGGRVGVRPAQRVGAAACVAVSPEEKERLLKADPFYSPFIREDFYVEWNEETEKTADLLPPVGAVVRDTTKR